VTTIRSISADELEAWARIDDRPDRFLERSIRSRWDSGSSRPEWCFLAERDGRPVGRVAFTADPAASVVPDLEFRIVGLWFDWDHQPLDIGGELLRHSLAAVLPPGRQTVDATSNPEYMAYPDLRRALYERAGFGLFQEKEGFLWRRGSDGDHGGENRLVFRSVAEAGEDVLAAVMSRGTQGTLDRNDRYYRDLVGPEQWGREMLGYLTPDDAPSWFLASTPGAKPVGYVLLSAFDEPGRATIAHIGVLPEHRGRGYSLDMLRRINGAAIERGFDRILSDVDVENPPMMAAMERAGHHADATPWHVWHYRLVRD
jgi:ribosomal protein S18 acetylase RimI-like enzyme